jgi:type IV pilus assembly protein PilV
MLANQLIGTMWVTDRTAATLQNTFNTGNAGYNAWTATVQATLPGVGGAGTPTAPDVAVDNDGIATITLRWLAPSEPANTAPHQYVAIAQIR